MTAFRVWQTQTTLLLEIPISHHVLTKSRVTTPVSLGNQIHSSTLWTLGFPKMYLGTLGYKGKITLYKL